MARKDFRSGFRRESLAVTYRRNRSIVESLITDPAQKARFAADFPVESLPALPVKRGPIGASGAPLERDVIAAVSQLLAAHPAVLFAVRQNSGGASYENASGNYQPLMFYRILTGQPVTITDFWGLLKTGRPFCIEAKRPGWKAPRDLREKRQALFISMIQHCGGVGGFVTSAEEAQALLCQ